MYRDHFHLFKQINENKIRSLEFLIRFVFLKIAYTYIKMIEY